MPATTRAATSKKGGNPTYTSVKRRTVAAGLPVVKGFPDGLHAKSDAPRDVQASDDSMAVDQAVSESHDASVVDGDGPWRICGRELLAAVLRDGAALLPDSVCAAFVTDFPRIIADIRKRGGASQTSEEKARQEAIADGVANVARAAGAPEDECQRLKQRFRRYSGSILAMVGFLLYYPPATNKGTELFDMGPDTTRRFSLSGLDTSMV